MRLARPARSWRFCRKELAGTLKPPGFSAKLVAAGGFATGLCFRTRGRQRAEALASVSPQSLRLRAWFDGWSVLSVGPENPKSRVDPRRARGIYPALSCVHKTHRSCDSHAPDRNHRSPEGPIRSALFHALTVSRVYITLRCKPCIWKTIQTTQKLCLLKPT